MINEWETKLTAVGVISFIGAVVSIVLNAFYCYLGSCVISMMILFSVMDKSE
jgi:hypothetical protein